MTSRRPLVAANWKMHGSRASISALLEGYKSGGADGAGIGVESAAESAEIEVAVCPPAVYIPQVARSLAGSGIAVGAQNLSRHESGAHTGEIAASMLRDCGCEYVIVGHSERRQLYGESNAVVAEKFRAARDGGLKAILCLGERKEERQAGVTEQVLAEQLDAVIEAAGIEAFADAVLAYEPVWAIGTGLTATPEQAQEAHNFIRLRLARHADAMADKMRVVYGGSVKADNAAEIFAMADVDGGLVGGASLRADDFLNICRAV